MAAASAEPIRMIAGLGNPGAMYENTRHNAGAWFVEELAQNYDTTLTPNKKFFGRTGKVVINNQDIHLLLPTTFMNCSGQCIAAFANFYQIPSESILIAHDELDFPAGIARLKSGGGHGGHNGLRDIISKTGNNKNFLRLRIGIGHPGHSDDVTGYVLQRPSNVDSSKIRSIIDESIRLLPDMIEGSFDKVMQELHSFDS